MARKHGKCGMGHDHRLRFLDPDKLNGLGRVAETAREPDEDEPKTPPLSAESQKRLQVLKAHADCDIAVAYWGEGLTYDAIGAKFGINRSTVLRKLFRLQADLNWPSYPNLVLGRLAKGKTVLLDALACDMLLPDRGWLVTLHNAHEKLYNPTHVQIEVFLNKHRPKLVAANGRGLLLARENAGEDLYELSVVVLLDTRGAARPAAAAQGTSLFNLREWRYLPSHNVERRKAA